jgi:hypothetical protein
MITRQSRAIAIGACVLLVTAGISLTTVLGYRGRPLSVLGGLVAFLSLWVAYTIAVAGLFRLTSEVISMVREAVSNRQLRSAFPAKPRRHRYRP